MNPRAKSIAVVSVALVLLARGSAALAAISAQTSNLTNGFGTSASFGLVGNGCISDSGWGGACLDGNALIGTRGVAVSPDGKNIYGASTTSDALTALSRNATTGAVAQLAGTGGCHSLSGHGGTCVTGKALDEANVPVVSADGKHVYATAKLSNSITAFSRDAATGVLTQLAGTNACISLSGTSGQCVVGRAMSGMSSLAISSDGKHVYAAADFSDAIVAFSRDATTGQLTQLSGTAGCISLTGTSATCIVGKAIDGPYGVTVSPDGATVYLSAHHSDAVAVFSRNSTTGALTQLSGTAGCVSETGTSGSCVDGFGLDGPTFLAVSPDNANLYVSAYFSDAVLAFTRNTSTGAVTQLTGTGGCVSEFGTGGACADGVALDGAHNVAVSPDGENLYAASGEGDAVTSFARDATSGRITQLTGRGCISEAGSGGACTDYIELDGVHGLAVSPDNKDVYGGTFWSEGIVFLSRTR